MRRLSDISRLLVIAFPALLMAAETDAEQPPSILRGKSLILSWTRAMTTRDVDGHFVGKTWSSLTIFSLKLYVSLQGRIFSSFEGRGEIPVSNQTSWAPKKGLQWGFVDGALVADQPLVRGVRRVAVSFSDQFRNCSVKVIYGRIGTEPFITTPWPGGGGHEIIDLKISSTSCAVQQGNIFGDPQ
jgi:hypothetical protein